MGEISYLHIEFKTNIGVQISDFQDEYSDDYFRQNNTIIFLELPGLLCMWNITIRRMKIKLFGFKRDDIEEGCIDKFEFSFYHKIWTYKNKIQKNIYKKLD